MSHQGTKASRAAIPEATNRVATQIVDAAYSVHSQLGPGLLESACETCPAYELEKRGLRIERQEAPPIQYNAVQLDAGLRLDSLVEQCVIVEQSRGAYFTRPQSADSDLFEADEEAWLVDQR